MEPRGPPLQVQSLWPYRAREDGAGPVRPACGPALRGRSRPYRSWPRPSRRPRLLRESLSWRNSGKVTVASFRLYGSAEGRGLLAVAVRHPDWSPQQSVKCALPLACFNWPVMYSVGVGGGLFAALWRRRSWWRKSTACRALLPLGSRDREPGGPGPEAAAARALDADRHSA